MAEFLPWIVVALTAAVAAGLWMRVRAMAVEAESMQVASDALRSELASTREQLGRHVAKQRRAAEETQELRRKLEKARRRVAQSHGGRGSNDVTRVTELESDLEATRQARDAAREEVRGLSAELTRLKAEARAKGEAQAAAVSSKASRSDEEAPGTQQKILERAEAAESDLAAARDEIAEKSRAIEKLRGKIRTQELLYVSIRSELAAKKDRLRAQHEEIERLQALKVAFIDSPVLSPDPSADEAPPPVADAP